MARKKERWFAPGPKLGWRRDLSQKRRINIALRHRNGNVLATARALNALANVTKDPETKRKARVDARKLFDLYRRGIKRRMRI